MIEFFSFLSKDFCIKQNIQQLTFNFNERLDDWTVDRMTNWMIQWVFDDFENVFAFVDQLNDLIDWGMMCGIVGHLLTAQMSDLLLMDGALEAFCVN